MKMAQRVDVRYIQFYTGGSAAQKVAPQVPLETIKLPKVKKQRQKRLVIHIDPVAVLGIGVAAVMLVLMVVGMVQLRSARQELRTMNAYVNTLTQENVSLNTAYTEGYDLESVKTTALALGLVPVDQVQHVTVRLPEVQTQETPGAWERFCTFLTGLFA